MTLAELLVRYRLPLLRHVERTAGRVLRYETAEDLVQGIHLLALKVAGKFEDRGPEAFLAWQRRVARGFLKDRRAYWSAGKRRPARLFRLTQGASSDPGAVPEPAGAGTGPSTFANRRELLSLALKALGMLLPRDRDLVTWSSEGVTDEEIGARLGLEPRAAARARQRAVERYRRTWRLLESRR